jgi:methylmalonyl-CoA mutase
MSTPSSVRTISNGIPTGIRVVLAKVGLDGHDRGIKVVARGLRDHGFHVIYSGLWQSPAAVAQIVADEDVAWLGISLLNGAHLSLIPRVMEALEHAGRADVGVIVGGIIPPVDVPKLKAMGVRAVFGPGTPIEEIARTLTPPTDDGYDLDKLFELAQRQDRVAIARLLTAAQCEQFKDAIGTWFTQDNPTQTPLRRIAITGSPGVGKSSLIAELLRRLRERPSYRIAVLACDPQSPVTGGALLGDRLRMAEFIPSDNLFIRSLATPAGSQGISPHLDLMGKILGRAGFDLLIIETVGIGQGEIAVRSVADQVVLVLQPQTGDAVQWDKAGLWELADLIVVQKCDLTGADTMLTELQEHLSRADGSTPSIVGVSSHSTNGWDTLIEKLGLDELTVREEAASISVLRNGG